MAPPAGSSATCDGKPVIAGTGAPSSWTTCHSELVGGSVALLKAAHDVAVVGHDEPIPLPGRP